MCPIVPTASLTIEVYGVPHTVWLGPLTLFAPSPIVPIVCERLENFHNMTNNGEGQLMACDMSTSLPFPATYLSDAKVGLKGGHVP